MRREHVITYCDITGEENATPVEFALDGVAYEIDLSDKLADDLRDRLAPYVVHGRPLRSASRARKGRAASEVDTRSVRSWAGDHGFVVRARGRVPAEVVDAYRRAHARL